MSRQGMERLRYTKPLMSSKSSKDSAQESDVFNRFTFKRSEGDTPIHEQVRLAIRQMVAEGQLLAGDKIPPLDQLCVQMDVGYVTAARAIRELVEEGILEARTARGTQVTRRRTRRFDSIGMAVFESFPSIHEISPYFRHMVHLLMAELIDRGFMIAYGHWSQEAKLEDLFHGLRRIDGLLMLGVDRTRLSQIQTVRRLGVPMVVVGDSAADLNLMTVSSDDYQDTFDAVKKLQADGHQHIAYVVNPTKDIFKQRWLDRIDGFRQSTGDVDDRYLVTTRFEDWSEALLAIEPRPTAVVLGNAAHVVELHQALRGTALDLQSSVHLCIQDADLWKHLLGPLNLSYTGIVQSHELIAKNAVMQLIKTLNEPDYQPEPQVFHASIKSTSK